MVTKIPMVRIPTRAKSLKTPLYLDRRIDENNGPISHYGFRGLIMHLMAPDWSPFDSAAKRQICSKSDYMGLKVQGPKMTDFEKLLFSL